MGGQDVQLVSYLGAGATSGVYECRLPSSCSQAGGSVVAKVSQHPHSIRHEQAILQELAAGGDCPCIPRVVGQLDNNQGILLSPVGVSLAAERTLDQHPHFFKGFQQLVCGLRTAHDGLGAPRRAR